MCLTSCDIPAVSGSYFQFLYLKKLLKIWGRPPPPRDPSLVKQRIFVATFIIIAVYMTNRVRVVIGMGEWKIIFIHVSIHSWCWYVTIIVILITKRILIRSTPIDEVWHHKPCMIPRSGSMAANMSMKYNKCEVALDVNNLFQFIIVFLPSGPSVHGGGGVVGTPGPPPPPPLTGLVYTSSCTNSFILNFWWRMITCLYRLYN